MHTTSHPKNPTISAGVDSLVHSTEAFVAKKTNPLSKMFAKEGFNIVFNNQVFYLLDLIILYSQ